MTDKNTCFICGESRPNSIEQHHIVPRRFGGSDDGENLVGLCASCHAAVEKLYDGRFYDQLGVESGTSGTCELDGCTASAARTLDDHSGSLQVCADHGDSCGANLGVYDGLCSQTAARVVRSWYDNKIKLRCDDHNVCGESGCKSREIYFDPESVLPYQRCFEHFDTSEEAESRRRE